MECIIVVNTGVLCPVKRLNQVSNEHVNYHDHSGWNCGGAALYL